MPTYNLPIKTQGESIILMNAIREHCRARIDHYHSYYLEALDKNDEKAASDCLRWRDEHRELAYKMTEKLDKIRRSFENMMDYDEGG